MKEENNFLLKEYAHLFFWTYFYGQNPRSSKKRRPHSEEASTNHQLPTMGNGKDYTRTVNQGRRSSFKLVCSPLTSTSQKLKTMGNAWYGS